MKPLVKLRLIIAMYSQAHVSGIIATQALDIATIKITENKHTWIRGLCSGDNSHIKRLATIQ